jgi:hypothetical protein
METIDENTFEQNEINFILSQKGINDLNPYKVNNNIGIGLVLNGSEQITSFIFKIIHHFYTGQIEISKQNDLYNVNFVDMGKSFDGILIKKVVETIRKELPFVTLCVN